MAMSAPSALTMSNNIADLSSGRRTQPCEALWPQGDLPKPWIAKPGAKNTALGM